MTRSNVPLWERPTLRHHDPRYGYVSVSDEYVAEVREHYRDIVRRIDALGDETPDEALRAEYYECQDQLFGYVATLEELGDWQQAEQHANHRSTPT